VDQASRKHSWDSWLRYLHQFPKLHNDPHLTKLSKAKKQQLLLAFAARTRTGYYGRKKQVGSQQVQKAVRHVAQAAVMAGYPDPRRTYGAKELDLPFNHLNKAYRDADPAPKPQVALPVNTIRTAASIGHQPRATKTALATGDLIIVAFFFLLRVGEYTFPGKRLTRTVQFRVQDVRFWKKATLLPKTATLAELINADSATLWIDNQKNGQRGDTIHHFKTNDPRFTPVAALARRVTSIRNQGMSESTPLSYVSPGVHVLSRDVTAAIRKAAKATNLTAQGYNIQRVGSHSLRASGAMALKLNGYKSTAIMKIGRWRSLTFLTYIHSQIAALNSGMSTRMSRSIAFHNVGS
jgi:integrase